MRMIVLCLIVASLSAPPVLAQTPPVDGVRVTTDSGSRILTGVQLDSLVQDTVSASYHERPATIYVGVGLDRLLARAGVIVAGARGRDFQQVVVVEAADGYRMVFGLGEIDPSITGRRVILARTQSSEDGPWRLVVSGDRRGARWVRQVRSIRLLRLPT